MHFRVAQCTLLQCVLHNLYIKLAVATHKVFKTLSNKQDK